MERIALTAILKRISYFYLSKPSSLGKLNKLLDYSRRVARSPQRVKSYRLVENGLKNVAQYWCVIVLTTLLHTRQETSGAQLIAFSLSTTILTPTFVTTFPRRRSILYSLSGLSRKEDKNGRLPSVALKLLQCSILQMAGESGLCLCDHIGSIRHRCCTCLPKSISSGRSRLKYEIELRDRCKRINSIKWIWNRGIIH